MRAESGNLAAVEHEDLIGITDGADALGDDDLCLFWESSTTRL